MAKAPLNKKVVIIASLIISLLGAIFWWTEIQPKSHFLDEMYWKGWAVHIYKYGISNAYGSGTNYLPFYQYILWFFGKLFRSEQLLLEHIYQLKFITFIFDIATGILILKVALKEYKKGYFPLYISIIYFLNPAVFYNTVYWGQVDSIPIFFIVLSFFWGLENRAVLSSLALVLAINTKLQAVIFVPFWFWMMFNESWGKWWRMIIYSLILQTILIFPFLMNGSLPKIIKVVTESMGYYPVVSVHAFNGWELWLPGYLMEISDQIKYGGLSYRTWGLIMFSGSVLMGVLILLRVWKRNLFHRALLISKNGRAMSGLMALAGLSFFYFNTEMHERYAFPALILVILHILYRGESWLIIPITLAYLANMERALDYFKYQLDQSYWLGPDWVAIYYGMTLLGLVYSIYKAGHSTVVANSNQV